MAGFYVLSSDRLNKSLILKYSQTFWKVNLALGNNKAPGVNGVAGGLVKNI